MLQHLYPIFSFFSLIGADIHARDYAGKKPKDLVKDTVAPDIQSKHLEYIYIYKCIHKRYNVAEEPHNVFTVLHLVEQQG